MSDDIQGLGTTPDYRDLILELVNWEERPKLGIKSNVQLFGFEGTVQQVINHSEEQPHNLSFSVMLLSLEEIYNFLKFWHDRKGMHERFWFPLMYNVFELMSPISSGVTQIVVSSPEFEYRGFERLYLYLNDGSLITRKITQVTDDGDNLILTVSEMDRQILAADVVLFSLFLLCHFDVDQIELNYSNPSIASTNVRISELVNEYDLA